MVVMAVLDWQALKALREKAASGGLKGKGLSKSGKK